MRFGHRFYFKERGHCPCCDSDVYFRSINKNFRDELRCSKCDCIPRERAIMKVIEEFYSNWKKLKIHESSPANRGASIKLARECPNYTPSQFDPKIQLSELTPVGYRNENLEKQTFDDESFDLVITQDVFEHLFDIHSAFKEIKRTLRPGGAHIFTTPLVNFTKPTEVWAQRKVDGSIEYLHEPEYHGNPFDSKGSLVTYHFGYDICKIIFDACGLFTSIIRIDDIRFGIRADLIEVLVTRKSQNDLAKLA